MGSFPLLSHEYAKSYGLFHIKKGQDSVALGVKNLRVMNELVGEAKAARLTTFVGEDAGRTEVEPGTVTVAAIGPAAASDIDKITGHLRLY